MERIYIFKWYKNTKYNKQPIEQTTNIKLNNPIGDTSIDAKRATELFCHKNGSLKNNTIINIKETDEHGKQIGEDIIPKDGSSIIPIARKK